MRETIIAIVLGACGSLLANAVLFATIRLRQWSTSRLRILLALNVTALIGGGVAFAYIACDSITHETPLPVGGSVVVGCAFVALVVLGYFFCIELVKTTSVRATLARIDAILGQRHMHLRDAPALDEALSCVLAGVREAVDRYGPFFDGGVRTVPEDLARLVIINEKPTIKLARKIEEILRTHCSAEATSRFHHVSFDSDETGKETDGDAKYEWVMDPIDGSRHFARGLPLFTISVALVKGTEPVLSVVYVPVTAELFFAVKGRGAYLNTWTNHLHVSDKKINDAVVHAEFPNKDLMASATDDFLRQCRSLEQILSRVYRVRGLGLGSLGLAYVAKGSFDGYVTLTGTTLRNDVCAGLLLVEEAGGKVGTFAVPSIVKGNVRVLAANETIFDEIMAVVKK
jgi:myo-inositol-1(or 4)-monophosphatase